MIHHVFANKSNIGDWLSARGIQSLLGGSVCVVEHFCDAPFVPETLARLGEAKPTDVIVIGGGGLFMDYFTPFWEGICQVADRVPVCIWGVGYCELKQERTLPPQDLIDEIVAKSRICAVRDEHTLQRLARYDPRIAVGCPSLCVLEPPPQAGHGILHVDNYSTVGANAYEAMDAFGRQTAAHLSFPYRTTNNRIVAGDENALRAVLRRYAESDVVLTSALHGCILAVGMGRKLIAVSGDCKIDSFMHEAGLAKWLCQADEVDRLGELWTTLAEQEQPHRFVCQVRERSCSVAAQILSLATCESAAGV